MARLRYADLARKPLDVLDMSSLTRDEFQTLVPPFEAAFQRLCGKVVSIHSERGLTGYAPFLLSDLVKRSQTTLHTVSEWYRNDHKFATSDA